MRPPRFTRALLPAYSYVPGSFPHPHSDPAGHHFGVEFPGEQAVVGAAWRDCQAYLLGLDLFNHGYYWEAHEAWEVVWRTAGGHEATAAFLKGLIQLAVVGVKVRQGMNDSAIAHARRAAELFQLVGRQSAATRFMGLELNGLTASAADLAASPPRSAAPNPPPVAVIFPFFLVAQDGD